MATQLSLELAAQPMQVDGFAATLEAVEPQRVDHWRDSRSLLVRVGKRERGGMAKDIQKSTRGDKTAYLGVGAWYNVNSGHIHLSIPGSKWFITTVAPGASGKRSHPNLYRKLARALKEAGVPAPVVQDVNGSERSL
jgi:hypothetical protein